MEGLRSFAWLIQIVRHHDGPVDADLTDTAVWKLVVLRIEDASLYVPGQSPHRARDQAKEVTAEHAHHDL